MFGNLVAFEKTLCTKQLHSSNGKTRVLPFNSQCHDSSSQARLRQRVMIT